jgi:hypothetical protein
MEHKVKFVDHVQGSSTMAQWACSCGERWVSSSVMPCPKSATSGHQHIYRIISLGWGVQSFTLAVMSALGDLPKIDAAVHADTTYESILTYQFAERWTDWLEANGVKVVTVKNEKNEIITNRVGGKIFIPAFTNTPSSNGGQLRRQCTQRWKIAPLRRWLQAHRNGAPVEQWLGISLDEFQRMRDSDVKYVANVYPLIDNKMTRANCVKYLESKGIEVPPKSACTFCPYHNTAEWRRIAKTPEDWGKAVALDEQIRTIRPPYDLFVHPSRKPLAKVDLRTAEDKGQMSLWDAECAGLCGV